MKKKRDAIPQTPRFYFSFFSSYPYIDDPVLVAAEKTHSIDDHSFRYESFYFRGEDLRVYPVASEKGETVVIRFPGLKKISRSKKAFPLEDLPLITKRGMENSWDIFYKHATFASILRRMTGEYEVEGPTEEEAFKAVGEVSMWMGKLSIIPPGRESPFIPPDYKALLALIRDKPYSLHNCDIRKEFIDILIKARYSLRKKEKDEGKELLLEYLIPKHRAGKKPLLPGLRYDLGLELMKRLAVYLSEMVRKALNGREFFEQEDLSLNDDAYNTLVKWAEESHEYRISTLKKYQLRDLILKPCRFTEDLIEAELGLSIKTIQ